jgi:ribosome-binding protein aMBF1 (putative translation factor)
MKGVKFLTNIRALREEQKLSITGLSHQLQVNATVLSLAERRKLAPSARVRKEVCAFLGLSEQQAFDTEGLAV